MADSTWNKSALFPGFVQGLYFAMLCAVCITLFMPIKLNSMAMGFLFLSWIPSMPWKRLRQLWADKLQLAMVGFFLLYAIGLLYTDNMDAGQREIEQKLPFFALPILICTGPGINKAQFKTLIRVFYLMTIGLTLWAAAIAIHSHLTADDPYPLIHYFTYRYFTVPVGFDPIYMGLYTVLAIFLLIYDSLLDSEFQWRPRARAMVWLVIGMLFVSLIFISSRMEILVFIAALSAMLLLRAMQSGQWLKHLAWMIAVPLAAVLLISVNDVNAERFTEMVDLEADYTENKWGGRSIRIEKWKNAAECWATSPIIGVGSGDTMDELIKVYEKNDFQIAIEQNFNPHNQYLETAMALGIIGLALLLYILIGMAWRGWKKDDWLLLILSIIIALSMVTESMLERQKGFTLIVFFSVLMLYRHQMREQEGLSS